MILRLPIVLCAVLGILLWASPLQAQRNVLQSDPLRARSLIVYDMIGGYMGLSFNSQGGTITTDCNCDFTGAAGTGFVGGFQFERLTRSGFLWGVTMGYENRSLEGRFREIEGLAVTSPTTGRSYTVPIDFLNTANLSLHYLSMMPYLKLRTLGPVYVRGGVTLSYVFSSALEHLKTLETTSVTLPNGESATVSLPGYPTGTATIQDGPVPELNTLQIGGTIGVGLDLQVGEAFFLSPVLQYTYPFTAVTSAGGPYSTRSLQLLVEGRFIL